MWICAFRVLKVLLGSLACTVHGVTEIQMWLSDRTKTTVIILYIWYYLRVCAGIPAREYPHSQTLWIKVFLESERKVKSLSCVRLFGTLWTVGYQASPSMGFSRQGYWSGLPFSSPGDLPDPGIKPRSPALEADALTSEPPEVFAFHTSYMKSISRNI